MKKVITVDDLCCEACAKQMAVRLALLDGVLHAKADYKKRKIFIEVLSAITDETLKSVFEGTGMTVLSIELRKGLFH
ncbi:MAG: heavy-metal-associated domain-containing protein [Clostridia bacterium]|nr:heavy-metal-associated domain-containing protein [Clostridia bacterium]MBQ8446885.1 heavy-metal-associated domain-containing protein [Clostridia bacterium]